jgi:integrase
MLAYYTGQRKGDVLTLRWNAIQDNVLAVKQRKTGKNLWIPLHPVLSEALDKIERIGVTIVSRQDGQPITEFGFNRNWRRQQAKLKLINRPFHGLRRNAVNALLEAGCTIPEVCSITGQSFEMVQHYAREVDNLRLAQTAMGRWVSQDSKGTGQRSGQPTGQLIKFKGSGDA